MPMGVEKIPAGERKRERLHGIKEAQEAKEGVACSGFV